MPTADLSVVMPNYNHARFLPRALDAILAQSPAPREVIVLDDASTDNSIRVIQDYACRHASLRFIQNERNLGVVATMNRGLALARSTYVLFAAADDYVLPGFFAKAFQQLAAHPEAGLCTALDSYQHGENGVCERNVITAWGDSASYYPPDELVAVFRHTIPGHATICRRDALQEQGGFQSGLRWYCDWFAFLTVAFRRGACQIPEMLAIRVLLPENYSAAARSGETHVGVLGVFLELMRRGDFADVASAFQRNGAASIFGTDLIRAAARRPDCWQREILGFLNGFTPEQYEALLHDSDETVRAIAEFFLGPYWRTTARARQQQAAELARLRTELDAMTRLVPPPGARGKCRWLARLFWQRMQRVVRLHAS